MLIIILSIEEDSLWHIRWATFIIMLPASGLLVTAAIEH